MSRFDLDRARGGTGRRSGASRFARPLSILLACLLLTMPLAASSAAAERDPDPGGARPKNGDEAAEEPRVAVADTVTVTGSRLRGEPQERLRLPANVTVLSRRQIERSGAATLQELLERQTGAIVFDQVGNGVSRTFDLRGFTGTGTRVLLDGAPINDPRNNALTLELVPLAALERIEIARGSTASLAGGGSEAGVVNLFTRRGSRAGGEISLAAGEFGTVEAEATVEGRAGGTDLFFAATRHETDGFRDNTAGELGRLAATAGRELGGGHTVRLSLVAGEADYGAPGALTAAELAADRSRAPFNVADFSEETSGQAALNYRGPLSSATRLSANLFHRRRESRILTTGRAAPLFGGFFLDSEAGSSGATLQVEHDGPAAGRRLRLSAGAEWLQGNTDARGFFTSPADPGRVDPAGLGSDNTAKRTTTGLFVQQSWRPADAWTVTAGVRIDRDEMGYDERLPAAANDAARRFSELSLRGGVNWQPVERWALYLSYGEAFLPPTVEELFSFPLFGSNPGLRPEDSRSVELGARGRLPGGAGVDLAVFEVDTRDEIVFDPGSALGPFGANVNAGRTRRRGLEASLRTPEARRLRGYLHLTKIEAEFRNGPARGSALPLVPPERVAAGLELDLPRGFDLRAHGLWVAEQPLDNDDGNLQPGLEAYAVVDARLTWAAPRRSGGPTLFLEARNLFDERYATRGIFAFDFATFRDEVFLTPAPGRRVMGGVRWTF